MALKQKQDAFFNNCLFPYICSFLNATDLIRSRSICSSWKNIHKYATHWIQNECIPSSFLTQMVVEMKELIYCDVVVVSKNRSWDLIIHSHQKLTYLRICHSAHQKWDGGNCEIGLMPKLHTLEIHDAERSSDTVSSQFDFFHLKTPNLDKLTLYNLIIPDYCVPVSISQLTMSTKPLSATDFNPHYFNLEHCTKLLNVWCESPIYQSQRFEIFSQTVQFCYCDSFRNFGFHFPNLKWLCVTKWLFGLPSAGILDVLAHKHPQLQKLFVEFVYKQKCETYETFSNNHSIEVVELLTSKQFEIMVAAELGK